MKLILATNNPGKIREYTDVLVPFGFSPVSQREAGADIEVEETGTTFAENALLKARAVFEKTHGAVLADDSGLMVEALHGEPGIYSARYKGLSTEHEKRMAILDALKNQENRRARFVTCICFIDGRGEHLFTGVWDGSIAYEETGDTGFGYDPIFIADEAEGHTTASLPASFKETHSHRAKALQKLLSYLKTR